MKNPNSPKSLFRRARVIVKTQCVTDTYTGYGEENPYTESAWVLFHNNRDNVDILAARQSGFTPDYASRRRLYPVGPYGFRVRLARLPRSPLDIPRVHRFDDSGEAYDATQCDDAISTGDSLVIVGEGVVGLAWTWPLAITEESGEFHVPEDGRGVVVLHDAGIKVEALQQAVRVADSLGFKVAAWARELAAPVSPLAQVLRSLACDERKCLDRLERGAGYLDGTPYIVADEHVRALICIRPLTLAPVPCDLYGSQSWSKETAEQLAREVMEQGGPKVRAIHWRDYVTQQLHEIRAQIEQLKTLEG